MNIEMSDATACAILNNEENAGAEVDFGDALSASQSPGLNTADGFAEAESMGIETMGQEVLGAMQAIRDMMEDRARSLEQFESGLREQESRLRQEEAGLARQRDELTRLAAERQRSLELESAQLASRESELASRVSALDAARRTQETAEEQLRAARADVDAAQVRNVQRAEVIAHAEQELKRLRDQLAAHCERLAAQREQLAGAPAPR